LSLCDDHRDGGLGDAGQVALPDLQAGEHQRQDDRQGRDGVQHRREIERVAEIHVDAPMPDGPLLLPTDCAHVRGHGCHSIKKCCNAAGSSAMDGPFGP
jgi:hypothetical protein